MKILLLLTVLLLAGCTAGTQDPQISGCRIVRQIDVEFENGPLRATRLYTDPEKMRRILNYLRLLNPYGIAEEDPQTAEGSVFRITVSHSDGCQTVYRQQSDQYFSENDGPWMRIHPQKAQELSLILGEMESDT